MNIADPSRLGSEPGEPGEPANRGGRRDTAPPGGGGRDRERLVQDGLDHLQRAARETIAAMRTLLDLAEELVEDPHAAETLVSTLGSFAEAAVRSGADLSRGRRAATAPSEIDDEEGGVQRIPLS